MAERLHWAGLQRFQSEGARQSFSVGLAWGKRQGKSPNRSWGEIDFRRSILNF
jgi:hypothetical protein